MKRAKYEKLEDGYYWGEIPDCPGVNAYKPTLFRTVYWSAESRTTNNRAGYGCQEELREVLEEWILLNLRDGIKLPIIEGINLNIVTKLHKRIKYERKRMASM
jgi:predicted RNase H-like HicB family nuclease